MEVIREYNYLRDGRKVCIKRAYNIKGIREAKKNELDEYFKQNAESIKASKNINNILDDYNGKHVNKISFSMMYQKYKAIFGTRKSQKHPDTNDGTTEHGANSAESSTKQQTTE